MSVKMFSSAEHSPKRWDMKLLIAVLVVLLAALQYKLWVTNDGLPETMHLQKHIALQQQENQKLEERNQILRADVDDLKQGNQAIEERARHELGMIKQGEVFYQLVPQ